MSEKIESTNEDLDNLPEAQRKETESILDEINKGEEGKPEKPVEDPDKKPKPEGDKPKEGDDKKPELGEDGKPKKTDSEDASKVRRDTKLIPAWKVAIQEKETKKTIEDLTAKIDDLTKGAKPAEGQDAKPETKLALADKIKKAVEQFKVDVDPAFMEMIVEIAQEGREMPKEITDRLAQIDALKEKTEVEAEEMGFNKDFDAIVLPLIKAEYGDDIEADKLVELKEKLKAIAYTDEYAKIPYDEIYAGKKDFRGFVTPKSKSAEGTRKSGVGFQAGEKDYVSLTEEEVKALPPEEFDKWSNAMAANERKRG